MNKRNIQNEKLDQIERKLLRAGRVPSNEIERITDAPELFEAIKTQIRVKKSERRAKSILGNQWKYPSWNWQIAGMTFAGLAVLLMGVASLIVSKKFSRDVIVEHIAVMEKTLPTEALVETAQPSKYPKPDVDTQKTKIIAGRNRNLSHSSSLKNEGKKQYELVRKPQLLKQPRQTESEITTDFYPLTFAGNAGEANEELYIFRVELSRSSLFALGVNLTVENESDSIKTDLLVGADGITREIRLVK